MRRQRNTSAIVAYHITVTKNYVTTQPQIWKNTYTNRTPVYRQFIKFWERIIKSQETLDSNLRNNSIKRNNWRCTTKWWRIWVFFFFARQPPTGPGASVYTRFLDHTQRRTTVGRSPLGEWSALPDKTQPSQQTNIHASGGIRTHNLSRRAAADLRLRPRNRWDRRIWFYTNYYLRIR